MPRKFDNKLEEVFYKKFNARNVKFITSDKVYAINATRPSKMNTPYDISLNVGGKTIAILDFKSASLIDRIEKIDTSYLEKYAHENKIRIVIITDGERFLVSESGKPNDYGLCNFEELIEMLNSKDEIDIYDLKNKIAYIIKDIIVKSKFEFTMDFINYFDTEQLINWIEYDEIVKKFSFRNPSDINSIENKIFRRLLNADKPLTKIYRYTTLDTIFAMLNYNSFRMNCLVGMNDTTEVNYAENFITGTNTNYSTAHWKTIEATNKRFISSCSLNEDDLTQWRLYAEDSKGVCLGLSINEQQLSSRFILKPICYGRKGGKHPELELITKIISDLKNDLNVDFVFKTLSTWKHFFKPFEYKVENEVRLLYILEEDANKSWLLTASHKILNPFVEFKLNDDELPFELTEIILGPKCPEKDINKKQFEQFIRDLRQKKTTEIIDEIKVETKTYKIDNLKVLLSKINNYR